METTYKIIGADGREYGPVTLAELNDWIRQGRVAATTQVLRSDETSWKAAAQFPEFSLGPAVATPLAAAGLPPLPSAPLFQPVGFWARVGAWLIDIILLKVLFALIWGNSRSSMAIPVSPAELLPMLKQLVAQSFLQLVYYVLMNGAIGATVGKLAIGARIVFVDGSKIGFGTAFLRWAAQLLSGLLLGVGYLMIAFREDKRALHDLLVGTRVIYKRQF